MTGVLTSQSEISQLRIWMMPWFDNIPMNMVLSGEETLRKRERQRLL